MKHILIPLLLVGLTSCASMQSSVPRRHQGWISLFDGKTLNGWSPSENKKSVKVRNGMIVCDGPRSHLFYTGEIQNAQFKNFELRADVMTTPGANSGLYFHTEYQEKGWPSKGYEVQVNNTHQGEGEYRELKKTGSLYAVRNVYKNLVSDYQWFSLHITVRGKHVMVHVNDVLVVDYVEPPHPVRSKREGRRLSQGTFAIQCHDPHSKVFFKNIEVKPLPDDLPPDPVESPVVDDTYQRIVDLNAGNFPLVDYHVHLKGKLTLEDAIKRSQQVGINYGIAPNCGLGFPITDDKGIYRFIETMKNKPVFVGMQAEGREWVYLFSKEALSQFDYVFTDAMTFTDDKGRRTRLWMPDEVHITDKQAFMDMYVDRILGVLNNEPIDIYVNPTFLPAVIADEYDELWTEERMMKVINAAVQNNVAIEINARYRIPSATFIKRAKKAGCKFSFGTNNADENFGRLEYCLDMQKECKLTWKDMFIPKKYDFR